MTRYSEGMATETTDPTGVQVGSRVWARNHVTMGFEQGEVVRLNADHAYVEFEDGTVSTAMRWEVEDQ